MTRYIYIYTRKGTLLSGVAYPHIDIGLIESYPRGTSCRGDTCRSFIKDRQNKSRVKGLLVPYGTIELAQLAPSSTATIFSSTRTRIHGVLPACSSSPTLPIKKNRRSSLNSPTDSQVLRDLKKKIIYSIIFKEQHILLFPSKNTYPIFLVPNDCYPILLPSKILLHAKGTICSRDTDTFG